jgi:uncharacterized protein (UPF0333 family)
MELLFLIVVIAIGAALVRGYYHGGLTGNHRQLALTAEQGAQYAVWIKSCTDQYLVCPLRSGPP